MRKSYLTIFAFFCFFWTTYAQDLSFAKALVVHAPNTGNVQPWAIGRDGSGNIYVTGSYAGTVDFDPDGGVQNLTSVGGNDIFLAKYNSSGVFQWAKSMGGTSNEVAYAMAVDASGNSWITGDFQGIADFDPNGGVQNLTSAGSNDIFLAKYDASGNVIFANSMGGPIADQGYSVAVDGSGNSWITGGYRGTADFDPGGGVVNLTDVGNGDIFFAKYSSTGALILAKSIGGGGGEIGNSLAIDGLGNMVLTGYYSGTSDFDPSGATANLSSVGGTADIFLAKYDGSGNYIYAKSMGGTGNDGGGFIGIDGSNNAYITGYYSGTADFDPGIPAVNLTSAGGQDIFLAKYDVLGDYVYAKSIGGSTTDQPYSLAVDAAGNAYVTGYYTGTADFDPNAGLQNRTSSGGSDIFLAKYNVTGNYSYAISVGAAGQDEATWVIADGSGNAWITGDFRNIVDFDPGAGVTNLDAENGTPSGFFARYGPSFVSPTATISGNQTICSGGTATLTFSVTGTGTVTVTYGDAMGGTYTTSGTQAGSPFTATVGPLSAGTHTFTITSVQDANGPGTGTGTATIVVTPAPTATIGGTSTVCAGSTTATLTFTATGAGTISITYANSGGQIGTVTGTAGTFSGTVVTPATPGTYTYTITSVQDANGCTGTGTGVGTVTVASPPTATIAGTSTVCAGSTTTTLTFTATGSGTISIIYANSGGQSGTVTGTAGTFTRTVVVPVTPGTYTYTITSVSDASGCTGTSTGVGTVTVTPNPTATMSGTSTVCAGSTTTTLTFTATGTGTISITYANSGGQSGTVTGTAGTFTRTILTPASPGTYTYTITSVSDASGCTGTGTGVGTVTVTPNPTATMSGTSTVCAGSTTTTLTFTATGSGTISITYANSGGQSGTVTGTAGTFTRTVLTPASPGTYTYTITGVRDASGCTGTGTSTAIVNATPCTDLSITKSVNGEPLYPSRFETYSIKIRNNGGATADNVEMNDVIPAGTVFVSFTAPAGWTVTTPPVGGTGTVNATKPTLTVAEGVQNFVLTVKTTPTVAPGTVISNTATVTSTTTDSNNSNNSSTATKTVTASPPCNCE